MLLDDLKNTFQNVGAQVGSIVGSGITNKVEQEVNRFSGSTAGTPSSPQPSIPDVMARGESGVGFMSARVFGVPAPLLVAAGLALILVLRRK